ncbi:hypothetical protein C8Q76DRAFT_687842 [Earliella scabrosa]|nr:hypothetical protein C8Q76DRAFT_687842 [Earliella scabrosa]
MSSDAPLLSILLPFFFLTSDSVEQHVHPSPVTPSATPRYMLRAYRRMRKSSYGRWNWFSRLDGHMGTGYICVGREAAPTQLQPPEFHRTSSAAAHPRCEKATRELLGSRASPPTPKLRLLALFFAPDNLWN